MDYKKSVIDYMPPLIDFHCSNKSIVENVENRVIKAFVDVGIYVDRDRLIRAIEDSRSFYNDGYNAGVKAADVVPVRHGEWERIEDDYFCTLTLRCSLCHEEWCFEEDIDVHDCNYNFCPNCGAKMDHKG